MFQHLDNGRFFLPSPINGSQIQQHHQEAQITDCHDCLHSEWLLSFFIRLHRSHLTVRYLYDCCLSTPFQLGAGATDDVTTLI